MDEFSEEQVKKIHDHLADMHREIERLSNERHNIIDAFGRKDLTFMFELNILERPTASATKP